MAALDTAVLHTPSAGAGFGPPMRAPCSLAPARSRTPSWHLGADTRNNWSGYKEKRKKTSHEKDQLFVGDLTSCMSYHVR